MNCLYAFPRSAYFGKVLPKTKIYEHASVSSSLKKLFISEVGKIIWSYKLSPETINIPAKDGVQEIQVFTVELKKGTVKLDVINCIDRAIPSPIIFQLIYESSAKYVAAYKRPSEADKKKWVVSSYFETEWISKDSPKIDLPVALNLSGLHENILLSIINVPARKNEALEDLIHRYELIAMKERELAKLYSKLQKEKQFNRKVEINSSIRQLNDEIEELKKIT